MVLRSMHPLILSVPFFGTGKKADHTPLCLIDPGVLGLIRCLDSVGGSFCRLPDLWACQSSFLMNRKVL